MSFTFQLCWQVQSKFPPPVKQPAGDSRRGDSAAPATAEQHALRSMTEMDLMRGKKKTTRRDDEPATAEKKEEPREGGEMSA